MSGRSALGLLILAVAASVLAELRVDHVFEAAFGVRGRVVAWPLCASGRIASLLWKKRRLPSSLSALSAIEAPALGGSLLGRQEAHSSPIP